MFFLKDFFISYTSSDENRATWIAQVLEKNGYSVIIQAWDFRPGDNFVSKINQSLKECQKLIMVLSNNYLKSVWCEAEWTVKLSEQTKHNDRRIIPIRIENIVVDGLLSSIVYIDIFDKTESEAIAEILKGIEEKPLRVASQGFEPFFNIEHIEIDIDYYVHEKYITYIKKCRSKVLTNGFQKLHNRITWFSDESVEVHSLTNGVSIEKLDLHDTNLNYNVVFNHSLQKDEEIEFQVKAILSNINKHFKNFFSTEVITPIKHLNIHLHISDPTVSKIYTQKVSSSPMNLRTEEPNEHDFSASYHWYIQNPELNFEYKIFWEGDDYSE